ncbi:Hypothetical protein LOCK908_0489 [Lacticaseibacillus rhamnosus LOCK908]|uniref:Uncharacterized protein n=1 Tax=Lacticaseibacillus rhamnosus LRHMDP3 TaxID=1203259 RepID=A0AB33XU95_LACRH|nr:Hypothetical protein LOCK908_0489 [Lacticaseibacillus rhamnosus LOCK908]EKS50599.1 hypothetical protein LRHMDP3_1770 [Lacticaseibacillus rhamnosus LRHMDP3]
MFFEAGLFDEGQGGGHGWDLSFSSSVTPDGRKRGILL